MSKRKQKEICKFTAGKIPKLTPTFFAKHHHYSMDFTNSDIQIQKNKGHSSLYFEIHELCSCPFSAYQGSASQHFRIICLLFLGLIFQSWIECWASYFKSPKQMYESDNQQSLSNHAKWFTQVQSAILMNLEIKN